MHAWMSGIRRDQSPDRAQASIVGWDKKFGLVKISPLANWTKKDVWKRITDEDIPYNPLHDQGFPSIGCWPCTRAVGAGETDERAGRWSGTHKTECGLHTAPNKTARAFSSREAGARSRESEHLFTPCSLLPCSLLPPMNLSAKTEYACLAMLELAEGVRLRRAGAAPQDRGGARHPVAVSGADSAAAQRGVARRQHPRCRRRLPARPAAAGDHAGRGDRRHRRRRPRPNRTPAKSSRRSCGRCWVSAAKSASWNATGWKASRSPTWWPPPPSASRCTSFSASRTGV